VQTTPTTTLRKFLFKKGEKEMTTTTATPSRATATTGTRSAFPLVAFFALAYALSWLILVPAGFGLLPDSAGILAWLAPFGPAVAAFVVTALTGGRPAVGQLLRRMVQWRVGIHWYLLILVGVPLVELLGAFVVLRAVPIEDLAQNWPLVFTYYLPQVLVAVVVIGLAEETGWRGFALPRLQDRQGPLLATAVLAVLWAAWHLPNLLFGGWTGASYALWLVLTLASAFVYTWVFNNTGGSILFAAMLHAAINMGSGLVTGLVPGLEDASNMQMYGAAAIAFVTVALVLIAATRGRLGYRAERVPLEAPTRS
jgi:membrane protease YdiL (CAAX protease family)